MSKIVLVDAYSQIYRNFYAVSLLTNSRNEPVNALFGMARLLLQLDKTMASDFGAVVFDKGKAAKRLEICPEYKAGRPPMPEQLRPQIEPIRQWIEAFGWPIVEQEGLEADDLIAAIARRHEDADVAIVTQDKDISQLTADPRISIITPEKKDTWNIIDAAHVEEKFGVPPHLLGDYLALVGDSSDNICGVMGVGPKTASKLLNEIGGLDAILANPSLVTNAKLSAKLAESKDLLIRNRKLVALDDELPQEWHGLESIARRSPDWPVLIQMATAQNFSSLLKILQKRMDDSAQPSLF